MAIKYKDPTTGNLKEVTVKVGDTLPLNSIVEYDGNTVPDGYEEVDDPNVYSTTETKVGTWIDGRPIYRKVLTGTIPTTSTDGTYVNGDVNINSSNIDNSTVTINWNKTFFINNSGVTRNLPMLTVAEHNIICYPLNSNTIRIVNGIVSYNALPIYITVEYCKTTD